MSKIKDSIKKKIGITSLQNQVKEMQTEIERMQKELENSQKDIRNSQRQDAILDKKICSTDDWLRKTREELWNQSKKTEELKKEYNTLSYQVEKHSSELNKHATKLDFQESKISDHSSKISDHASKINDHASKISDHTSKLFKLKNNAEEHRQLEYKINKYMDSNKYAMALEDWYYNKTGKNLNLENTKTFNEIIQWTKLYDMGEDKIRLVDKYLVRDWIKEKIGEKYLVPLLGVWEKAEDIDFEQLPSRFVLKCNHGCGYNIIVTNKAEINKGVVRNKLENWLHEDFSFKNGFELQYSKIKRYIIAEEYIENNNQDLYDYKVFCFNGEAKYIMFLSDRKQGLKMQFYDLDWNLQPFVYSYERNDEVIEKPENLDELIQVAEKLAADFIQVRVDFYRLNDGTWKFGEMTFTSASGIAKWEPEEYDEILGRMIDIKKS